MRTSNLLITALLKIAGDKTFPNASQIVFEAGAAIPKKMLYGDKIYIVERGVAVNIYTMANTGRKSQVNMIGLEGIFPIGPLLDVTSPAGYQIVPHLGNLSAHAISAKYFKDWIGDSVGMHTLILQYLYYQMAEKNMTICCMDQQSVEERVARSLLMCHDRSFGNIICVTHDEIAQIVSSYRPTVTVALHRMEEMGSIVLQRSKIEIVDRSILLDLSNGSYGPAELLYDENITKFSKD